MVGTSIGVHEGIRTADPTLRRALYFVLSPTSPVPFTLLKRPYHAGFQHLLCRNIKRSNLYIIQLNTFNSIMSFQKVSRKFRAPRSCKDLKKQCRIQSSDHIILLFYPQLPFQSSTSKPATRPNSRTLFVTNVYPSERA